MSQLSLIIKNEYLTDIRTKSFWIGTILIPILMIGFGVFIGFMMADSNTLKHTNTMNADNVDDLSGMQVLGMMAGRFSQRLRKRNVIVLLKCLQPP